MAFRIPNPDPMYFNDDGTPCANGTLETYTINTSTPVETFSDPGLTTSNGTVVDLDVYGRRSVDMWSAVPVRLILKNADGVEQGYDRDDVEPGDLFPAATAGTFLYTDDGTTLEWVTISQVPDATGSEGYTLKVVDGVATWVNVTSDPAAQQVQTINFTDAGDLAIDLTLGKTVVINQSADIGTLSVTGLVNNVADDFIIHRIKDNSATTRAFGLAAAFQFGGKTTPTWTQTANAHDVLSCHCYDGGTTISASYILDQGTPP